MSAVLDDRDLRSVFEYWLARRGERLMPSRAMTLGGHIFERPVGEPLTFGAGVQSFRPIVRLVYDAGAWSAF